MALMRFCGCVRFVMIAFVISRLTNRSVDAGQPEDDEDEARYLTNRGKLRDKITNETLAREWLRELNVLMEKVNNRVMTASWNYNVNLTETNNKISIEANLRSSEVKKAAYENASLFDWKNFKDADLIRQFRKVSDIGCDILPPEDVQRLDSLRSQMQLIYSTAEVCKATRNSNYNNKNTSKTNGNKTCHPLSPDLTRIVATSRDWDEQLWAWLGWRDATGKKMKSAYAEMVQLLNKGALVNGYKDNGDYWRSWYEMENFTTVCDQLWQQIKPLYQQLHAYVRRRLVEHYRNNRKDFPKTGHIPAHLTGNMWAQTWSNILDLVIPFKNSSFLNITKLLINKNFDARRMFRQADDFFKSIGLHPMTKEFWERSLLEKPRDGRLVVCHASAWDFFDKDDFRIKQCTDVTGEYLLTTHHEMGHVQYYLHYKNLPVVYRKGANPGFHEAVGDVMALSVNTPQHLHKIGLLNETNESFESDINFLMKQALDKISFLPFGYLIDMWRWDIFHGIVTPDEYNRHFWKLRCKLQGIAPPVPRSDDDFDAASKFHVPHNTPYIRYFVSFIIQFQFHKTLCLAAGHRGPLHKCDIYNSKAAGDKLSRMLELGSSKPWPEAMRVLTGQSEMDAGPLLEYFQQLHDWLKEENKGKEVTWDDECPPEAFHSTGHTTALTDLTFSLSIISVWFLLAFINGYTDY